MADPYRIFISYTREDEGLALAIKNSLERSHDALDLRVEMMRAFRPGVLWRKEINDCLRKTDLLLIVYTGQLKPSHSWTGFEVGYFSGEIERHPYRLLENKVTREIVPVNFLGKREKVTETIEGIEFSTEQIHRPDIALTRDGFISTSPPSKSLAHDQLYSLLSKIENNKEAFTGRRTPDDRREDRIKRIAEETQKLYLDLHALLRHREMVDDGLQNKVVISMPAELGAAGIIGTLDGATIEFKNAAENVFNISKAFIANPPEKRMPWEQFRELVKNSTDMEVAGLWISNLTHLASVARATQFIDGDLLIPAWDKSALYRAIVTRRISFYSGRVDVHIYLFDLLKRADYGDEDTSLYLNAVSISCRYRSLFLEAASEFSVAWMKRYDENALRTHVMVMLRELDLIHQDTIRSGLNTLKSLSKIYGTQAGDRVAETADRWKFAESNLRSAAIALLMQGSEGDPESVRESYLKKLLDFCVATEPINSEYLSLSIEKLKDRISELAQRVVDAAPSDDAAGDRHAR